MTDKPAILPTRAGETDAERRLREAINLHAGKLQVALDSAIALRTAPQAAQHDRHRALGHLKAFAAVAMVALAMTEAGQTRPKPKGY